MLEMIVFAIVFVVAQSVVGLIGIKYIMSEKFMMKYSKMTMKISKEIAKELMEEDF